MSWPTVRRYPRTLAEAFPDIRAHCIEVPAQPRTRIGDIALAVAIGLALATALVYGWEI